MVERISTGISSLDRILDYLRWGDNVVWQVDEIEDYRYFVKPFINQALSQNRKVVYMRFGEHPAITEPGGNVKVYNLDASSGFEAFSAEVHAIASTEGEGICYVFDCLSDLLSAWATDLMIGNFFRVTCPYLFQLNTIAYFAILRGRNSYQTIARIRDTTQLLLEVYRYGRELYVHPLKVWNRYSPTMFLPHIKLEDDFVPITSSTETARLFSRVHRQGPGDAGRWLDYWDKVFLKAEELMEAIRSGDPVAVAKEPEMIDQLCRMMIGRDERVLRLARKYFRLKDLLEIRKRLIGSGFIGGKTVGMLLARCILQNDSDWDWEAWLEAHDSFYVGSDVYYTYLVENGCWNLRMQQKKEENYFTLAEELRRRIREGILPEGIREQFRQMLEYFGQAPIIVRSSSLLEDSFGNAFAGKYESIFCVNQGSPQERLSIFEEAVKIVFASTMSEDALAYRLQRGLAQSDEQMALLVQRVSGSQHGHYFFPDLAGVALSRNPYTWKEDMEPEAGMTRIVVGLGTRAVDRVDDDYPRLVALDQPLARPDSTLEDLRRFSQRKVDLLDIVLNDLDTVPLSSISGLKTFNAWKLVAMRDHETTRRMRELGHHQAESWILTFDGLLTSTPFASVLRKMLHTLEEAYQHPVDIEYTVNFDPDYAMQFNLLQCRPLQTAKRHRQAETRKEGSYSEIIFQTRGTFMGGDFSQTVQRVVYVQPEKYIKLSVSDKYQVARLIGRLNRLSKSDSGSAMMLVGPGRWGTSTPSLGVPVSFAEICNATVLVELAGEKEGFMPELSFGTHFFQDLVEAQILYVALYPLRQGTIVNLHALELAPNMLGQLLPEYREWEPVVKVVDFTGPEKDLWVDVNFDTREVKCYLVAENNGSCSAAAKF